VWVLQWPPVPVDLSAKNLVNAALAGQELFVVPGVSCISSH
jgi:hypothetical protein